MFGIGVAELLIIAAVLALVAVPILAVTGVIAWLFGSTIVDRLRQKPPE